ncbi:MAG: hypothetical protein QM770_03840 [Tepidisphaeraceae bacterium]
MKPDLPPNFDPGDPALREALRRLRGNDRASPELRTKIAALLAPVVPTAPVPRVPVTPVKPSPKAAPTWRRPVLLYGGAIAAAVAVSVALQYWPDSLSTDGGNAYVQDPTEAFYAAMVSAVDPTACAASSQPEPVLVAIAPGQSIDAALTARLGRFVPPMTIGAGWVAEQPRVTEIAGRSGALVTFKSGERAVTFVTLGLDAYATLKDGQSYDVESSGHHISGFAMGGNVFCLVSNSTVAPVELAALRDHLLAAAKSAAKSSPANNS